MATPLSYGKPIWLARQDPDDPEVNPNYKRSSSNPFGRRIHFSPRTQ